MRGAGQWEVGRKDRFPESLLAAVMVYFDVTSVCSAGSAEV